MSDELVLALAQVALVLVAVAAACLVARRRMITRRGGGVECCLRSEVSGRWQHGLAEYRSDQLYWHRSLSLRVRPAVAFDRRGLVVTGSRPAGSGEGDWLGPGTMIVTCQARLGQVRSHRASRATTVRSRPGGAWPDPVRAEQQGQRLGSDVIELALSQGALTGYLAWLEAAPASYLHEAS